MGLRDLGNVRRNGFGVRRFYRRQLATKNMAGNDYAASGGDGMEGHKERFVLSIELHMSNLTDCLLFLSTLQFISRNFWTSTDYLVSCDETPEEHNKLLRATFHRKEVLFPPVGSARRKFMISVQRMEGSFRHNSWFLKRLAAKHKGGVLLG